VLGTEHVAMNYFELAPGDAFAGGVHAHGDQEEVFYVLSGTATFEVGPERERVDVEAGELIRFAPGSSSPDSSVRTPTRRSSRGRSARPARVTTGIRSRA